jgi:hypothetical protein
MKIPDCRDFLYFRQQLLSSRRFYDDNINHRLNNIDTRDPVQCRALWKEIIAAHQERKEQLLYCIDMLSKDAAESGDGALLSKEVPLLFFAKLMIC